MSKRFPTPEEKRLWRESNRFTQKRQPDEILEDDDEELHEVDVLPSPQPSTPGSSGVRSPNSLPASPLRLLPPREAKRYLVSHPYIQATLDLHGTNKLDARELVQHFITRNHRIGRRHVIIITGKGRVGEGVLRKELPHWLNEPSLRPLLACLFHASARDGGSGVMHIILKAPKYKPQ